MQILKPSNCDQTPTIQRRLNYNYVNHLLIIINGTGVEIFQFQSYFKQFDQTIKIPPGSDSFNDEVRDLLVLSYYQMRLLHSA